jgi:hypothetical protein
MRKIVLLLIVLVVLGAGYATARLFVIAPATSLNPDQQQVVKEWMSQVHHERFEGEGYRIDMTTWDPNDTPLRRWARAVTGKPNL